MCSNLLRFPVSQYGPQTHTWFCRVCRTTFSFSTQKQRCIAATMSLRGQGFDVNNMVHAFSIVHNYANYATFQAMNQLLVMPETTYYAYTIKHIWPAVERVARHSIAAALKRLLLRDGPIILAFDGGWAHRGFHSKQACLPVIDFFTGEVVFFFVAEHGRIVELKNGRTVETPGSNPFSSKGAESFMIKLLLDEITTYPELVNRLYGFVLDQDSTADSTIRKHSHPLFQRIHLFADTGHAKKGVSKSVTEIIGISKRFGGLSRRVGLMFMGIIKRHTKILLDSSSVRSSNDWDHLLATFQYRVRRDILKWRL